MTERKTYAVLGLGNGGHAFAAYLALQGQSVQAWDVDPGRIQEMQVKGSITAHGDGLTGTVTVDLLTPDLGLAVKGTDVILIVVPAMFHASIAANISAHLSEGQLIILNPGATGGSTGIPPHPAGIRCPGGRRGRDKQHAFHLPPREAR